MKEEKLKNSIDVGGTGILAGMDATDIAAAIKNRDFSVKEAIECVAEKVALSEPSLNAIVSSNFDPDLSNVATEGVFAGVPTFIKDLVKVKGFATLQGSRGMPGTIAKKNEKVIDQIASTGFVVLGKSTTSEFGLLPSTNTLRHGETRNPRNLEFCTGGSSGGAGALVAAGVVPIAHAMDGGGSIRIPASCCGLVGLKPSRGRHVASPTQDLPIDIVTNGVVSKSVRDTANYFHGIEQFKQNKKLPSIGHVTGPSKRRLKIAVFSQNPAGIEAHVDVSKAVNNIGLKCQEMGHQVEFIANPYDDRIIIDFLVYYSFLARSLYSFGRLAVHPQFNIKKAEPFTIGLAKFFGRTMLHAPGSFRRLKNEVVMEQERLYDKYDVLLSPAVMEPVPKLGYLGGEQPFTSLVMRLNNYVNFTILQNASGAPSISLPVGKCSNGLPIGPQFSAKLGDDKTLLELAFELEQANAFIKEY